MSKPPLPIYDPIPLVTRIREHLESCIECVVKIADSDVRALATALIASDAEIALARGEDALKALTRELAGQRHIEKRRILDLKSNSKAKVRRDAAKLARMADTNTTTAHAPTHAATAPPIEET